MFFCFFTYKSYRIDSFNYKHEVHGKYVLFVDLCIHPIGAVGIYNEVIRYWRWLSWLIRF